MTNEISTTRRGFLRGSVGTAGVALVVDAACSRQLDVEGAVGTQAPAPVEVGERVDVSTTVNGKQRSLQVHPDDSTLDVVRKELGLTGSKLGCGHGACGACTMQLDGTPVVTCLLPATALEGRSLVTVEGLAKAKALHPIQRAFMAEDALQCGYCTPGFVVEAAAFHDAWRKANGDGKEPSREQVADALAGHLCRCGAYAQIYAAVQGACVGKFDAHVDAPRYDAQEKVTGKAAYTVDQQPKGMLWAKSLCSPHGSATVTKLDWTRALALPGVRGAISVLPESKKIRHAGQEIMVLAATDERTAEQALQLVDIEYDVQPVAIGIDAALAPDAAVIYPAKSDRKHPPNSSEGPLLPEAWVGNLRGPLKFFGKKDGQARRNLAAARKGEGSLVEGTWRTQIQCHTTLEPHAALAEWHGEDELTVHLSTQAVTFMAKEIAERWDLKEERVRVIAQYVGGGFGAKATLTTEVLIAVELAKVCGAPVLYALDRRQELMIGGNRPAAKTEIALATDTAGKLVAMRSVTHNDSGVAVGGIVGIMHRIVYPDAPREIHDYDVLTNAPAGKPMRGPAGPQAYWALEQAVDQMAHERGEDPVELRKRWDPNPARNALYSWVQALPEWKDRPAHKSDKGRWRRGVGLAAAAWFSFTEPQSRIKIDAGPDGIVASTAAQDMGNGTRTSIAQVIAESLGIPMRDIDVRVGDSHYVPGPMAGGSRTTSTVVPSAQHAAEQLKEELVDLARKHFELSDAKPGVGGVEHAGGKVPWSEVLAISPKISVIGKRKRDEGGYFMPPAFGIAIERALSGSVQVVEVELDTRLGRLKVLRTWAGFGVGRIVSPVLARSQAQGGIIQGISYALYEERRLDPKRGFLLSAGLEDYRIMGIGDVGEIHIHFDETGYEKIRGRSVGLGELVTLAPAAAIGNAVFHATGWRPRELPLRPDRVLQGVRA
jgi:xanthine dehydrogenase YagR molybdenum-binding subunit